MRLLGWTCLAMCAALSGMAVAQNTGTVTPTPDSAAAEPVAKDPPAGGCMPIGITASGEVVFPLQCREFIEQQKISSAKPPDGQPTTPRSEAPMPEPVKPSVKPADPAPLSKRVEREPQDRAKPPPGCTNFRSYDAASGTYYNYEGQRRRCR
jgi:hypothetical protein